MDPVFLYCPLPFLSWTHAFYNYCLRPSLICGSSICILSSSLSYLWIQYLYIVFVFLLSWTMLCVVIVFVLFLFVDRVFVYCLCPSLILDPVFVYCLRPSLFVDPVFVYCLSVSVATGPNSIHPSPRSSLCYYECSLCIFSFDCCCSLFIRRYSPLASELTALACDST